MWWLIGYMVIGIGLAEGTIYNKRKFNMPPDVSITVGGYSAVVVFWFFYLLMYLYMKGRSRNGRS